MQTLVDINGLFHCDKTWPSDNSIGRQQLLVYNGTSHWGKEKERKKARHIVVLSSFDLYSNVDCRLTNANKLGCQYLSSIKEVIYLFYSFTINTLKWFFYIKTIYYAATLEHWNNKIYF